MICIMLSLEVPHIYKEANSAMDWIAACMANNIGTMLWDSTTDLPAQLLNILFSDSHECIYTQII